jgi:hypothetical protein
MATERWLQHLDELALAPQGRRSNAESLTIEAIDRDIRYSWLG